MLEDSGTPWHRHSSQHPVWHFAEHHICALGTILLHQIELTLHNTQAAAANAATVGPCWLHVLQCRLCTILHCALHTSKLYGGLQLLCMMVTAPGPTLEAVVMGSPPEHHHPLLGVRITVQLVMSMHVQLALQCCTPVLLSCAGATSSAKLRKQTFYYFLHDPAASWVHG